MKERSIPEEFFRRSRRLHIFANRFKCFDSFVLICDKGRTCSGFFILLKIKRFKNKSEKYFTFICLYSKHFYICHMQITQNNQIMNLSTFSTNQSISTGIQSQKSFQRTGKIHLTFHINKKFVGISIEGFCIDSFRFVFSPKTNKEVKKNMIFVDQYVMKCNNPEEILSILKNHSKI